MVVTAQMRPHATDSSLVMLRESGASSTPRLLGSITDASGILVHPLSRVMTIGERDTASRSRRMFRARFDLEFPAF